MGSSSNSPPPDNIESKGAFHKPASEAACRNYRRRSPAVSSSSSDVEEARSTDKDRMKDDSRDGRRSRGSEQGNCNDRYSSRSSQIPGRREGKHTDGDEINASRQPSRSHRESRGSHYDIKERESEYNKSRDHYRGVDSYNRDRDRAGSDRRYDDCDRHGRDRDDRRDYKRDFKNNRNDRTATFEESRGHRSDKRDRTDYQFKESYKNDAGYVDDLQPREEKKKKPDEQHIKDSHYKGADNRFGERGETAVKKSKFSAVIDQKNDGSIQDQEVVPGVGPEQVPVSDSDLAASVNSAKVAAMKAAELVNKKIIGTGVMTADQKKKLLWGSKKSNKEEESSNRWNTAFADREQQEKFKKLMGVKGDALPVAQKRPSNQDGKDLTEAEQQIQMDLERQYTAGLRRRDGRTVGLGL